LQAEDNCRPAIEAQHSALRGGTPPTHEQRSDKEHTQLRHVANGHAHQENRAQRGLQFRHAAEIHAGVDRGDVGLDEANIEQRGEAVDELEGKHLRDERVLVFGVGTVVLLVVELAGDLLENTVQDL
jgi:hypothetical protein